MSAMSAPALSQHEYWNSKVGEEWANQADRTDRMLQPMTEAVFKTLALRPGERVLDIGCGAGATTMAAARQVGADGAAVGVDISRPLLEIARRRADEAKASVAYIEADAGAGAIDGAPFDAAFSRFGVMFFEHPPAAFAQLRASLRPDGRLVFVCWRTFAENEWSSAPLTALSSLFIAPVPAPDPDAPGPFAFADAGKIETILAAAGWREPSITPWDGDIQIGENAADAAYFLLKIGPCARAVTDQQLDPAQAKDLLAAAMAKHETPAGVALPAACWIVQARA